MNLILRTKNVYFTDLVYEYCVCVCVCVCGVCGVVCGVVWCGVVWCGVGWGGVGGLDMYSAAFRSKNH